MFEKPSALILIPFLIFLNIGRILGSDKMEQFRTIYLGIEDGLSNNSVTAVYQGSPVKICVKKFK